MNSLAYVLIYYAPRILAFAAIALFIGGLVNAFSSLRAIAAEGQPLPLSYFFTFIFGVIYQPAILVAWAAAIHYLSLIAGRKV